MFFNQRILVPVGQSTNEEPLRSKMIDDLNLGLSGPKLFRNQLDQKLSKVLGFCTVSVNLFDGHRASKASY